MELGSVEFREDDCPERIMYVNHLEGGGLSVVLHNGETKNVISISALERARLVGFARAGTYQNDKKHGGRLEQWWIDTALTGSHILRGNLYDDPQQRWPEGEKIHTSKIQVLDISEAKLETLNTIYDLGAALGAANTTEHKRVGGNHGHGHVWERPDGIRARCGGPGLCSKCAKDKVRWDSANKGPGEGQ